MATDRFETLDVGLIFRSVGYRGVPIEGMPFDDRRGVIPNVAGRVVDEAGQTVAGMYTCGWIKRGPSGVIGTNKSCAADTVAALLDDLAARTIDTSAPTGATADDVLAGRNVRVVGWAGWQAIDRAEIAAGEQGGRPREKVVRVPDMLDIVGSSEHES